MKKAFLISAMFIAASAVGAWAAACAEGAAGKYGALTIATVDGKCVATLDPDDTTSVNIPNDINVDKIEYTRTFTNTWTATRNSIYTSIFPFTARVQGVNIAVLGSIDYNWGSWTVHATYDDSKIIKANTPYLIIPEGKSISFEKADNQTTFSLKTSTESSTFVLENTPWQFIGTYAYKQWKDADSQIGHVYGFAATDKDNVQAGQFVRVKAGAYIKPMRAYLYYNKQATASAPKFANGNVLAKAAEEELPQIIEVVFQDKDGNVMSIAQMNTITGEVTAVQGWYDMKGRRLNAKPTQKGTYFNNGKKVVIK